jgi:prepilin-type N-terminal cleavage/methylation domain-containing protein
MFNSKFKIQNSKLQKRGFSMVEIIFVIVIMGILAFLGSSYLPDNRLLNDTNFVMMKIKETQKNAIGNDINGFNAPWIKENNSTCITLNKDYLDSLDEKYRLSFNSISSTLEQICFDEYGRPYSASEHKLLPKIDINVTYNGKMKQISVFPYSGYVTLIK